VFSEQELKAIAEVVQKHENIMVIADEIYEYINFTGEHISIGAFPGMFERTVTVNGFSKGFAMTGWRVGYICAPEWLVKAVGKLQGQTTSGICSIAQRAAIAAVEGNMQPTKDMAEAYKRRRQLVLDLLAAIPGVKANEPEGAFYVFPDMSDFFGRSDGKATINDANELALYILGKAHVSTVSGAAFGAPNCIRISYAASDENLKTALGRMKDALSNLK
jgi:aspartate aminotransferase